MVDLPPHGYAILKSLAGQASNGLSSSPCIPPSILQVKMPCNEALDPNRLPFSIIDIASDVCSHTSCTCTSTSTSYMLDNTTISTSKFADFKGNARQHTLGCSL